MDKNFTPSDFEKRIYDNWMDKKYFKASVNKNKTPFTIIMPPPNITSRLHLGHAYGFTIMDSIARFKRMEGYETLLLPGCDHAAIATEAKVVDRLASQGITKQQLGREKFLEKMYEWYDEFGNVINDQTKLVGVSCDWDRHAFTLDEQRSKSVKEAFVRLYNKGLIYQKDRITNWCVHCKTAISDIEVEYEDNEGSLWHIKYPIENSKDFVVVATTRPETMLGDVAVAVNPKDKRYINLIGKNVILPLINKPIPVIADNYVEQGFGTGIVKITPAHDPNDYEIGLRHNLEPINIMNSDGTLNDYCGKYAGQDRLVARKGIVEDLTDLGLMLKIEKYKNTIGHCQRCHNIIEPLISKQWYVKMKELAERAIKVVKDKELRFLPQRFEKIYYNWMNNIQDWCISRQIWSGHRIPVYYAEDGQVIVDIFDPLTNPKYAHLKLTQDPDSLDTWFSSALWPFSTLGWPDETKDMDYFFPTSLMITGYDIIFFWIARMIFSSLEYTDKIPFEDVLITGLIRDSLGRKMSKSLGNGVDPLDIINKYGADTLRMGLLMGVGIGQDLKFSYDKITNVSNFLNKIWNASRFVLDNVSKINYKQLDINSVKLTVADAWIINELNNTIKLTTKYYAKYDLGLVVSTMYEFVWNKFCDWYIESSKVALYEGSDEEKNNTVNVLLYVLENILKLLHPITPFITEEIYLNLPNHNETIMLETFPKPNTKLKTKTQAQLFNLLMQAIKSLRNVRSEMNIADNVKTDIFVLALKENKLVEKTLPVIKKLAFAKQATLINSELDVVGKSVSVFNEAVKIIIPTSDLINPEKEMERLNGELKNVEVELNRALAMLNNQGFISRAPQNLIDAEKEKIKKYTELKQSLLNSINNL